MSPHRLSRSFTFLLATGLASTAMAQITPGNLLVVRSGDGAAALNGFSTAAFLDEFTTAGAFVQSIPLPTAAAFPQLPVTLSGTATSEGIITQSADGRYLLVAGYGVGTGTAAVAATTSALVNRVVARIALDGTIDSSTALTDAYSTSNIRSAASIDGTQFWTAGNSSLATTNRGACFVAGLGATTSVQLSLVPTNGRVVNIFGDQLYLGTGSTGFNGVSAVGTGLPTTSGQTTVLLNGFPPVPVGTPSPYDFYLADAQTLYVADDRSIASGGGIQKWTESAGVWTLAYTINPGFGCRGLTGIRDLSGTRLFATTTQSSVNNLVSTLDTGAGSTFTTIASALINTAFRGVRFVRTPYDVTFGGLGCTTSVGIPTIATSGAPISGNANFGLAVGNTPPFSLYISVVSIGLPINPPGLSLSGVGGPPCADLYTLSLDILLGNISDITGAGVAPLPLATPDSALWGLLLGTQHLVFDGAFYPSFGLPVGASTGMQVVIGS